MKSSYDDIKSRIQEVPHWFDTNGTPRYGVFKPENSPNIYAEQVILLAIACQNCKFKFLVELNCDYRSLSPKKLSEQIPVKKIHYGDPPSHHCVGDTMNSVPLRVVEFWQKTESCDFERLKSLEIECLPEWAKGDV